MCDIALANVRHGGPTHLARHAERMAELRLATTELAIYLSNAASFKAACRYDQRI